MTSSPTQKRGSSTGRLLAAALLLVSACFLLAADNTDNKSSGPVSVPKKEGVHPYNYPFGASPFSPSQAKTVSSNFISSGAFPSAAFCAKCHEDVHQQWRQSAHANSFRAPFYKKNVDLLIAQKGIEFSRHCEGCHNPIALVSGVLTKGSTADRSFDEDGITCMVCHSIQKVQNTSGTGSYVMDTPAVMVREDGTPVTGPVTFDDILAHPKLHGVLIHAKGFPGWENFGGFTAHMHFVREHHKMVERVAIVTDSPVAGIAQSLARHFTSADVMNFPFPDDAKALDWLEAA
jgi:hypothetical protein